MDLIVISLILLAFNIGINVYYLRICTRLLKQAYEELQEAEQLLKRLSDIRREKKEEKPLLLEAAERHYRPGTKAICAFGHDVFTVPENPYFLLLDTGSIGIEFNDHMNFVYSSGVDRWAEIVEEVKPDFTGVKSFSQGSTDNWRPKG